MSSVRIHQRDAHADAGHAARQVDRVPDRLAVDDDRRRRDHHRDHGKQRHRRGQADRLADHLVTLRARKAREVGDVQRERIEYGYGPGDSGTQQTSETEYAGLAANPAQRLSLTTYTYNPQSLMATSDAKQFVVGTQTVTSHTAGGYAYSDDGIHVSQTIDDGTSAQTTEYLNDAKTQRATPRFWRRSTPRRGRSPRPTPTAWPPLPKPILPGQTAFYLTDGHGSTRALLNSSGQVIAGQTFAYDAYGNPLGFDPSQAATERLYCQRDL